MASSMHHCKAWKWRALLRVICSVFPRLLKIMFSFEGYFDLSFQPLTDNTRKLSEYTFKRDCHHKLRWTTR